MSLLGDKCPTCGHRKTRSERQNRRYRAILRELSAKLNFSPDVIHEYCKRTYLGLQDLILPDGKQITIAISTADLPMHPDPADPGKPNWHDYMIQVEKFAAENEIYIED